MYFESQERIARRTRGTSRALVDANGLAWCITYPQFGHGGRKAEARLAIYQDQTRFTQGRLQQGSAHSSQRRARAATLAVVDKSGRRPIDWNVGTH